VTPSPKPTKRKARASQSGGYTLPVAEDLGWGVCQSGHSCAKPMKKPTNPDDLLREVTLHAHDALKVTHGPKPMTCGMDRWCPNHKAAHDSITRALAVAGKVARAEQAEVDMWLAHSDAGCEAASHQSSKLSELERGRLGAFNDIRAERDRLLRELEGLK